MSIESLPYPTREISNNIPLFLSDIGATALPISIVASGQTITALAGPGKAQSYHVLGGSGTTVTFNDPTTDIINGIFYKVIIVEEGVSVIIAGQTFTNSGGLIELLRVYYNNSWETITASQSSGSNEGSNEGSVFAVPNTLVLRNSRGGGCTFDETAPGSDTITVFNAGVPAGTGAAKGVNIFCDHGIGLASNGNTGASISGDALGAEIYSDSGIGLDVNGGTTGVRIVGGTDGIAVTSLGGIGAVITGPIGLEVFGDSIGAKIYAQGIPGDTYGANNIGLQVFGNTGLEVFGEDGTGAKINTSSGTYHATFGHDFGDNASTDSVQNRSFVERLRGAFGWFRKNTAATSTFTARLQPPDTLAADCTYTLPNATGTIALTSDIASQIIGDTLQILEINSRPEDGFGSFVQSYPLGVSYMTVQENDISQNWRASTGSALTANQNAVVVTRRFPDMADGFTGKQEAFILDVTSGMTVSSLYYERVGGEDFWTPWVSSDSDSDLDLNALSPITVGFGNAASGNNSNAFGSDNTVNGSFSTAIGSQNTVNAINSMSIGRSNLSLPTAHASINVGILNNTSGTRAISPSTGTIVGTISDPETHGKFSTAVGILNVTSGESSTAVGRTNTSSGNKSSTFGYDNEATNANSVAYGVSNTASSGLVAVGYNNTALATADVAVGNTNTASGGTSNAFGSHNTVAGDNSSAFGSSNIVSGGFSVGIGRDNNTSGGALAYACAVGYNNNATGVRSNAFGYKNFATGINTSAFGNQVKTSVAGTQEFGIGTGSARLASVRVHDKGYVALSLQDTSTALTDGGATVGAEADGTLMRSAYAIRKNGSDLFIDTNSSTGTVTSIRINDSNFTGNVTAPNLVTNNGANSFAVRPSSSGPVLSPTSLITQADGDVRYGQRNFSGISTNSVSSSDTTPIKVASVLLPIGLYYIDSLVSSVHGGGLCTIGLESNQYIDINVIESHGNDNTAHKTNPIGADGFTGSNRSAVAGTTFSRRVAGIVQITTHNTELSIQFSQSVANETPSTTRKRAYITATKLS